MSNFFKIYSIGSSVYIYDCVFLCYDYSIKCLLVEYTRQNIEMQIVCKKAKMNNPKFCEYINSSKNDDYYYILLVLFQNAEDIWYFKITNHGFGNESDFKATNNGYG